MSISFLFLYSVEIGKLEIILIPLPNKIRGDGMWA